METPIIFKAAVLGFDLAVVVFYGAFLLPRARRNRKRRIKLMQERHALMDELTRKYGTSNIQEAH